ncbi:Histone-lysine N-methyltransferase [Meloidogyne graminicola]|uniref:[histone H4]-lysine(20) N-methyltransferase n=1 Tax=Meloidogyne graminicola TaxID=189291 RepID=A0A8S9ZTT2_9BILA|nr:Histone-lysine N-methyltransferase [Meloidogyne graminicola]
MQSQRKITEYFSVRRSTRRQGKELQEEKMSILLKQIQTCSNEKFLQIYNCEEKGRGIKTKKSFAKGEFVVEYKGEIITSKIARIREEEYSQNENIGSYMYYFKHRGTVYCVDATQETKYKGRLINHSILRPNLRTRVIDFGESFYLILVARRDIEIGEELLYDYGERRADVISKNPWLIKS